MADNSEQGWKGPFGGSVPGEMEGREGGGGWVNDPMAVGVENGYEGHLMRIGDDPQPGPGAVSEGHKAGGEILRMVEGWPDVFFAG